jgi:hypothetical protein
VRGLEIRPDYIKMEEDEGRGNVSEERTASLFISLGGLLGIRLSNSCFPENPHAECSALLVMPRHRRLFPLISLPA